MLDMTPAQKLAKATAILAQVAVALNEAKRVSAKLDSRTTTRYSCKRNDFTLQVNGNEFKTLWMAEWLDNAGLRVTSETAQAADQAWQRFWPKVKQLASYSIRDARGRFVIKNKVPVR